MTIEEIALAKHIEIVDAMCGTGKTHMIVQWMKKHPEKRYLYISPMKEEVENRIPKEAGELDFKYPEVTEVHKTKGDSLLSLLSEGHNVAFTHSLYTRMTKQHINYVRDFGYTLIIDEELTLIEPLAMASERDKGYTEDDIRYLYRDGKITVDENDFGRVKWNWTGYGKNGQYSDLKSMCDLAMVYSTKSLVEGTKDTFKMGSLVVELPISLIEVAERCIAISYLFKTSVMDMFLQMKGINTVPFDMEKEGVSLRFDNNTIKQEVREKINFVSTLSTQKVGRKKLSYSWYENEMTREDADMIAAAIRSVARQCGATSEDVMWTLPKKRAIKQRKNSLVVSPQSYSAKNCYVYCGCRATNEFNERHTLIHALYRHPNVTVKSYLEHYGFKVDIDNFALSEMIQWVWRSRIREKKPINLCILSRRMHILFERWLYTED